MNNEYDEQQMNARRHCEERSDEAISDCSYKW
jgi:hypothetical protein